MTKLVWVGPNTNNKGGNSSKAYTVRRTGRVVLTRHGAVDVVGARGGKYNWRSGPVERRRTFRTEKAAAAEVKRLVQDKERKGYRILPGQVSIGRPPRAV